MLKSTIQVHSGRLNEAFLRPSSQTRANGPLSGDQSLYLDTRIDVLVGYLTANISAIFRQHEPASASYT